MKHNPNNLSDEAIDVTSGYRLLETNEIRSSGFTSEIDLWLDDSQTWHEGAWGNWPEFTYRTKLSPLALLELRQGIPQVPKAPKPQANHRYIFIPDWLIALGCVIELGIIITLLYLLSK